MAIRHVILDRDGVLNREAADGGWVHRPEDWVWETGALAGLRLLSHSGVRISVATNQSGVGRGVFPAADVEAVHRHMLHEAQKHGCRIDEILVCPHSPAEACRCRKPSPGLIEQAIKSSGVASGETVSVGDAPRDLEASEAACVRPILVRTGKGRATEQDLDGYDVVVVDDLLGAARVILANTERGLHMSIMKTFEEHAGVMAAAAEQLAEPIQAFVDLTASCLRSGHKVMVCGNGGSAADAQHLATELVCRFAFNRRALPALALTTDTSAMTAIANDFGFDRVFARQVEANARSGDVLIAISTSGRSTNVIEAAREAQAIGCSVVAMTGVDGAELGEHADLVLAAPSRVVARIQEVHAIIVHILAESIEAILCNEAST